MNDELDKILAPWLSEIQSEYGTGIDDDKKPQFIEIKEAKAAIEKLIAAKVEESYSNGEAYSNGYDDCLKEHGIKLTEREDV